MPREIQERALLEVRAEREPPSLQAIDSVVNEDLELSRVARARARAQGQSASRNFAVRSASEMEAVVALDTLSSLFGSGPAAVTTPRPQGSSSCAVAVGGGSAAGPSTSSGQVIQLSDADLRRFASSPDVERWAPI